MLLIEKCRISDRRKYFLLFHVSYGDDVHYVGLLAGDFLPR